ncbi:MAG: hypothetical protein DMD40_01715 [Gemmatimonadetes bacterium]|nr:MAG: hypothetical protein DMD40_01715 [Gemmatimonadota bacterium]
MAVSAKLRVAVTRVEPVMRCRPTPSANRPPMRAATASRRSVMAPSLVISSVTGCSTPRRLTVSWMMTPNDRSRYVEKPPPTTMRRVTGPAMTIAGKRVPWSDDCVPLASTERHDTPLVTLALMRRTSASAASLSGENASNGANAPPVVRARTLSDFPGVPSPRIPNCESWAARRPDGPTAASVTTTRRATAVRPSDRPTVIMAPRI